MNNIGYAFIGTPKGLQTKNGGILEKVDIRRYIDLDGNVIKVDPNTELFSIRKVLVNKDVLYFISQYEYAKEMESHRTGTFFGCTLVLRNAIAPAEAILLVLSELMASLREYIRPDGRFATTLERIPIKPSKRLRGLESNLKAMPNKMVALSGQQLFVHLKGKNDFKDRVHFIHQCLHNKNFDNFSTVYASEDTGILNFVRGNKTMRVATIGANYETKLEKMEAQYQQLQQKMEREITNLQDITKQKQALTEKVSQLSTKQNNLSNKYKETEVAIVTNLGKLQKLEKSLTVSVKSLEKQQLKAKQDYKASMQNYDADVSHFQQHLEDLGTSKEQLASEQQQLTEAVAKLKQDKLQLQKGNQRLMDDLELIRHNAKQSEVQKQTMLSANAALEDKKVSLESSIQKLQTDKAKLQSKNEQLMNDLEAIQQRIAETETLKEEEVSAQQRLATERAVLENELAQLQQKIETIQDTAADILTEQKAVNTTLDESLTDIVEVTDMDVFMEEELIEELID